MFKRTVRKPSKIAYQRRDLRSSGGGQDGAPQRKHRPDYQILIICLSLLGIGLIVVYSISPGLAVSRNVSENYFTLKQVIAILLGLVVFGISSFIPIKAWRNGWKILVVLAIIAAIMVQLFDHEVNGASRWIQAGGLSFQVAELIKLALVIGLSVFLVARIDANSMSSTQKTLRPILILLALIGVVVAGLESDLGSAGVMAAIVMVMAFTAGLPVGRISLILAILLAGTFIAISSSSYRRERVETFLNPSSDCQASGYQACQALIAVGSGGMFGRGLGKSVQAYGYLPEAANDSVFAVIAEKFGFIGVSLVIALYIWLFARMKRIITHTQDNFSRLVVVGVLSWVSVQAIINIGAMTGLLPLKGITLPFISLGGTSLVFIMAALGIVFQVSRYTNFSPVRGITIGDDASEDYASRRGKRRTYYASSIDR